MVRNSDDAETRETDPRQGEWSGRGRILRLLLPVREESTNAHHVLALMRPHASAGISQVILERSEHHARHLDPFRHLDPYEHVALIIGSPLISSNS
jgi:hypothetical protein